MSLDKVIEACDFSSTNNSQRARRDVVRKLARLGIEAQDSQIFTCAMATARFLAQQKSGGAAFVLGENGLTNALHVNGYTVVDSAADYVVVGEGRTFTFEMIEKAVRLVAGGAKLIATNMGTTCPTDQGIRPGCGAIVQFLFSAVTPRKLIWKPTLTGQISSRPAQMRFPQIGFFRKMFL